MPQKTNVLDWAYWIYCAARSPDQELFNLIKQPDFKQRWEQTQRMSTFGLFRSLDEEHARKAEQLGFVSTFRTKTNPAIIPIKEFISGPRPIRTPFSVIWGDCLNPLRVVLDVQIDNDLHRFNLALDEEIPFRWCRSGPKGRRCYLFGEHLWEVKPSELTATDAELRLLLLATVKKECAKFERLGQEFSGGTEQSKREPIPEDIQILVWRRDEGKCVKCGSQERLEYDHIIPVSRGGSNTARNIQLLCEQCNREKGNRF